MTGPTRKPVRHRVRDIGRDAEQRETSSGTRRPQERQRQGGKPGETEVPSDRRETDSRPAAVRAASSEAWPRGGTGADPGRQRALSPGRWVRRQSRAATAHTGEPGTSGREQVWRAQRGRGRGAETSGGDGAGYRGCGAGCGRPQAESRDPESRGQGRESGTTTAPTLATPASGAPHLWALPLPAMKPHPGAAPPARDDGHLGRGRGERPALPPPPRARRSRGRSKRTWDPGPSAALRAARTRRAGPGRPLYMRACGIRGRRRGPRPPHSPAWPSPSPPRSPAPARVSEARELQENWGLCAPRNSVRCGVRREASGHRLHREKAGSRLAVQFRVARTKGGNSGSFAVWKWLRTSVGTLVRHEAKVETKLPN